MKTNECPYKERKRDRCVHKFRINASVIRRKCGFPNPANCPLFLEWVENHTLEEEKLKIEHLNDELGVSHK